MKYIPPLMVIWFAFLCIAICYVVFSHFEQRVWIQSPIRWIAQTGPIKEGLKTDYFAEILDLSIDHPKYLDIEEVKEILGKNPLIKTVSSSYVNRETLYIDYTLRSPTFTLIDLYNVAVDLEGYLFPFHPYFTPKKLPELCLGLKEIIPFGTSIEQESIVLIKDIYHRLEGTMKRIDLSHIDEKSLGKREIIVIVELANMINHTLRLSVTRYREGLNNYQFLKTLFQKEEVTIDLRIPNLAYIKTCLK